MIRAQMIQSILGATSGIHAMRMLAAVLLLASFAAAQKETPLPKDLPPYGPQKPLASPSVKSVRLDNGLNLWLVSEPGFPKAALTVAVRGGLAGRSRKSRRPFRIAIQDD